MFSPSGDRDRLAGISTVSLDIESDTLLDMTIRLQQAAFPSSACGIRSFFLRSGDLDRATWLARDPAPPRAEDARVNFSGIAVESVSVSVLNDCKEPSTKGVKPGFSSYDCVGKMHQILQCG